MGPGYGIGMLGILPLFMFIIYGLIIILVITALILFIRLALRGIQALDIYIDEKRNRRL